MRHAAESVTDERNADVKLIDLRGALDRVPALPLDGRPERQVQIATGMNTATAYSGVRETSPRLFPRQLQRESTRFNAQAVGEAGVAAALRGSRNSLSVQEQSGAMRRGAKGGKKAGDGIRTHDVQLGKLAFYH